MRWVESWRADPVARRLIDGESFGGGIPHYSRQKPGSPQFVPPGGCIVLTTADGAAAWVTSTPFAQYVKHAWAGAWVNSIFRNEHRDADGLPDPAWKSSELIREAVAATLFLLGGEPPPLGIVSFVDADQTKPKRDPGRCYRRAGWKHVGFTKAGLWAFQQLPAEMPEPCTPLTVQLELRSAGGEAG